MRAQIVFGPAPREPRLVALDDALVAAKGGDDSGDHLVLHLQDRAARPVEAFAPHHGVAKAVGEFDSEPQPPVVQADTPP